VEYGFSVQQVSGFTALTITTQDVTQFPTNLLTVKVTYANGTVAAGAYVSASVIGSSYYWGYEPNVVTWATTESDGIAVLFTPTAPIQVDAWIWVPSTGTINPGAPTGVSGQVVNGTVIPVPVYLGLAGSALVVPPQTNAQITLQPQQSSYWATPSTATATPSTTSSSSSYAAGPGSVPYSVYEQQQGNPNLTNLEATSSTPTPQPTASPSTTVSAAPTPTPTHTIPEFPTIIIAFTILLATTAATLFLIKNPKNNKDERLPHFTRHKCRK
jgi:hypothetical protein